MEDWKIGRLEDWKIGRFIESSLEAPKELKIRKYEAFFQTRINTDLHGLKFLNRSQMSYT
ncbi:MAG: hypothetical protein K8R25_13285 [Methanosarcinales archaeon]|nr:hypothetical protein [Methanosarcinales archaeon]